MMGEAQKRYCAYCEKPVRKVRKGEHIIPAAIGGTRTIKTVCSVCNNSFSVLDTELCSRSPLSIIAAKEINGFLYLSCDVDERAGNLLIEGYPNYAAGSFTVFPQLLCLGEDIQFRGDYEQLRQFGEERFHALFTRRLKQALSAHMKTSKSPFFFNKIRENESYDKQYRYPPRVFVRGTLEEACGKKTLEIAYRTDSDKRRVFKCIERLEVDQKFKKSEVSIGSFLPTTRCSYDRGLVLRALAKIGINLLIEYCQRTPVSKHGFADVMSVVSGERELNTNLLQTNGFVWASDLSSIACSSDVHSARVIGADGKWNILFSFFGGQIGAMIHFGGPNHEKWKVAYIDAPIGSSKWLFRTSHLLVPTKAHITWDDWPNMMPTIEFKARVG